MVEDPIELLERELVAAAERRASAAALAPAPAARSTGAAGAGGHGRSLRRARHRLGLAAGVLAVLVPLAIALGALALLRGGGTGARRHAASSAAVPSLTQILGVLRRPQVGPRVPPPLAAAIGKAVRMRGLTLERRLIRGVPVSARSPRARPTELWSTRAELVVARGRGSSLLAVFDAPTGWFADVPPPAYLGQFETARELERSGLVAVVRSSTLSGSAVIVVVPDGVARVAFTVPGQRPLTALVHENLAGFLVAGVRFVEHPNDYRMTWYAAGGRVIRRVGPRVRHVGPGRVATNATNPTAPLPAGQLQQLATLLPVLRRAQTAADRARAISPLLASPYTEALAGTPDLTLLRLAAVTPWGQAVFLVPFDALRRPKPPPLRRCNHRTGVCETLSVVAAAPTLFRLRADGEGLGVLIGQFGCCAPATRLAREGLLLATRRGPVAVVPGDVARVRFVLADGKTLSAPVHGDIAAARSALAAERMIWFDARGRRVGPGG
jgi:hypothetical protein